MLTPTTKIPPFSLPNQDGKTISSDSFMGNWLLLYFYPQDDTPGCTAEACTFRDNFPFYEDLGIAVIGISSDSPESHKKFIEKYSLPFTLLSDPANTVITMYGAYENGTKRVSYLIAPDGTVAKAYQQVDPATHAQEVLRDLQEMQK